MANVMPQVEANIVKPSMRGAAPATTISATVSATKPRVAAVAMPEDLVMAQMPDVQSTDRKIPLFSSAVAAGFPSPAHDYIEQQLDVHDLVVKHPAATFFVRAKGESMIGVGIYPHDVLVVDRALDAQHGDIVIAAVDGDMTVKQLITQPRLELRPANPAYPPIVLAASSDVQIFGVVTFVIHALRGRVV